MGVVWVFDCLQFELVCWHDGAATKMAGSTIIKSLIEFIITLAVKL